MIHRFFGKAIVVGCVCIFGGGLGAPAKADTVQEAVKKALKNYPSVEAAEQRYQAARASLAGTWMQLLPAVNLTRVGANSTTWSSIPMPASPLSPQSGTFSAGLTVPLFDGGATFLMAKAAKQQAGMALETVRATKNSLALQVVQAYAAMVVADLELEYFGKVKEYFGRLRKLVAESDPEHASLTGNIALIDGMISGVQQTREDAASAYRSLVGEEPSHISSTPEEIVGVLQIPQTVESAIRIATEESPSVQIAEHGMKATKDGSWAQFANFFMPKLLYTINWSRTNTAIEQPMEPSIPFKTGSSQKSLILNWSLSPGALAAFRSSQHSAQAASKDLQALKLSLETAVRDAYKRDARTKQDIDKRQEAINAVLKAYEDSILKLEAGSSEVNIQATEGLIQIVVKNYVELIGLGLGWASGRGQLLSTLGVLSEL